MQTVAFKAPKNQLVLTYAVILALIAGFFFLRSFIPLIITATIVAFIFAPVYDWLLIKTKRESAAAALTLIITILAIVIPFMLIVLITVNQSRTIITDVSQFVSSQTIDGSPEKILVGINNFLTNISGSTVVITQDQVWEQASKYISSLANFILNTITSWVGSIGSIITNIILYMYILSAVLVHRGKLINLFKRLNPLGDEVAELYIARSGAMTKGMVRGQFTIAIIQGFQSAFVLWLTGVPYFAFWALILSFLSIIPLGAGIITIPIGIVRILLGDVWQGIVIVLNHLLVVTNIDNVLKPILVPKSVKLQPALIMLSVFAGISLFGFLGIIIGPVIMILIITTLDVYLKATENKNKHKLQPKSQIVVES